MSIPTHIKNKKNTSSLLQIHIQNINNNVFQHSNIWPYFQHTKTKVKTNKRNIITFKLFRMHKVTQT